MSHAIELSATEAEEKGIPVIRNVAALTAACVSRGLLQEGQELTWKNNQSVGMGNTVSGYEVRLPGWKKPVYFNTEQGSVGFDNWPVYGAGHIEVRNGNRRVGEEGRWGDFQHMLDLEKEYCNQASALMRQIIEEEAVAKGEMARVLAEDDEQIVMELLN